LRKGEGHKSSIHGGDSGLDKREERGTNPSSPREGERGKGRHIFRRVQKGGHARAKKKKKDLLPAFERKEKRAKMV